MRGGLAAHRAARRARCCARSCDLALLWSSPRGASVSGCLVEAARSWFAALRVTWPSSRVSPVIKLRSNCVPQMPPHPGEFGGRNRKVASGN